MFNIKIVRNIIPSIQDDEDISVVEAVQTIYKNEDSWIAEMNWNGYIIPLFGDTIAYLYKDILSIINCIESNKEIFEKSFLDASFTARWECSINNNIIHIKAFWFDLSPAANENQEIKDINSVSNILAMDKNKFIDELNILIDKVNRDLLSAGYDKSKLI